jgi:hypothetical protein
MNMDPIFAVFEVIKNVYIPCFSMEFDHMLILNYSRVSTLYIHNPSTICSNIKPTFMNNENFTIHIIHEKKII